MFSSPSDKNYAVATELNGLIINAYHVKDKAACWDYPPSGVIID